MCAFNTLLSFLRDGAETKVLQMHQSRGSRTTGKIPSHVGGKPIFVNDGTHDNNKINKREGDCRSREGVLSTLYECALADAHLPLSQARLEEEMFLPDRLFKGSLSWILRVATPLGLRVGQSFLRPF